MTGWRLNQAEQQRDGLGSGARRRRRQRVVHQADSAARLNHRHSFSSKNLSRGHNKRHQEEASRVLSGRARSSWSGWGSRAGFYLACWWSSGPRESRRPLESIISARPALRLSKVARRPSAAFVVCNSIELGRKLAKAWQLRRWQFLLRAERKSTRRLEGDQVDRPGRWRPRSRKRQPTQAPMH